MHAFVDESSRKGYLLCAVIVVPSDVDALRRVMRGLCVPGQRRVHMKSEGEARCREILSVVGRLDIRAVIYRAELGRSERHARDDCFRAMIPALLEVGVERLLVESCGQDRQDKQVIREMVGKAWAADRLSYAHSSPTEPLLLPDIVAWAYGRGGEWWRRLAGLAADVVDLRT